MIENPTIAEGIAVAVALLLVGMVVTFSTFHSRHHHWGMVVLIGWVGIPGFLLLCALLLAHPGLIILVVVFSMLGIKS